MNKSLSQSSLIIITISLFAVSLLSDPPLTPNSEKSALTSENATSSSHPGSDSLIEISAEWIGTPQWMSGVDNNYEAFGGSIAKGTDFFGSNLTAVDYFPVEIRLNSDSANWSNAQFFKRPGYASVGVGTFPGSVWDISEPANPRRLNVCIVEFDDGFGGLPDPNFKWDPDTSAQGKFEYLFIMKSDYDSSGMTYADSNVLFNDMDNLYVWWPRLVDGHAFFETDSAKLVINTHIGLLATALEDLVYLSWVYPGQNPDNFKIFWDLDSIPDQLLTEQPGHIREFAHTELMTGIDYYYQIRSFDSLNNVLLSSRVKLARTRLLSLNISLFGQWNDRFDYGDIWGYTDSTNGKEYALICARFQGLSIIDINDTPFVEVGFVPGGNDAKDVKIYRHYAVIFQEGGPTLIADIADVTKPQVVSSIPGGCHNGLVDGHYIYQVGGNPSGLVVYSILDPANPDSVNVYSAIYYHDVAIRNDTMAACGIFGDGVDILDLTNKSNIQLIGQFNYPGSGAHNAAFSEDGDFLFVGDEIGGGRHTRVFDISNLSSVKKVADIIVNPNTVTHNSYVKGDHLFIAHYVDGLRVWNVKDPTDPYEVAFYDTHLQTPTSSFEGAWGVYPYFESGKVIVSDVQTGLYVFNTSLPGEICCVGNRGDIDGDGDPTITVTDMTYLIDFIFRGGPAPACEDESDVNADNIMATITDLTFVIDRIFRGGPAPSSCP